MRSPFLSPAIALFSSSPYFTYNSVVGVWLTYKSNCLHFAIQIKLLADMIILNLLDFGGLMKLSPSKITSQVLPC